MPRIYTNANQLAVLISKHEGLKKSIDIAQIKEVLRITRILLRKAGVDIYQLAGTTPTEVFNERRSQNHSQSCNITIQ